MPPVDISVAMCTYNRAHLLRKALDSLVAQETEGRFSYEVVVVDDASTDATPELVAEVAAEASVPVRYHRAGGNGVAQARNCCIDNAQGEWVAYTDDDQHNDPRWLLELHLLAEESGADCVGGVVDLDFDEEPTLALTPVARSILGEKIKPRGRIVNLMDCPGTGNAMFRRNVFERIGRFDEGLVWGGEDADLMMRVMRADIPVWFAPESVVHHMIPPYRVTEEYFRWASLRVGVALAEVDGRIKGRGRLAAICVARVGQALLLNVPKYFAARLLGNEGLALEKRCVLWRAVTYTRQTIHLLAPRLFPQRRFFEGLTFRAERSTVAEEGGGGNEK